MIKDSTVNGTGITIMAGIITKHIKLFVAYNDLAADSQSTSRQRAYFYRYPRILSIL